MHQRALSVLVRGEVVRHQGHLRVRGHGGQGLHDEHLPRQRGRDTLPGREGVPGVLGLVAEAGRSGIQQRRLIFPDGTAPVKYPHGLLLLD